MCEEQFKCAVVAYVGIYGLKLVLYYFLKKSDKNAKSKGKGREKKYKGN